MKRVLFGYKGGFPLEQETLIQLQKAYSIDMLEALFALWGLDPAEKYLVKRATSATDDGWIIFPFETVQINPVDGSEIKVEKPQLLRLQYIDNSTQFNIVDLRETDGSLEYAQAGPDGSLEKKVYEEFVAQQVGGGTYAINSLTPLDTILKIASNIANNATQINAVKENYLPRDGSKPMTGDLNLGYTHDLIFNNSGSTNLDYIAYNDGGAPPNNPNPGIFNFVADKAKGEPGNAWIRSGGVLTGKVAVGVDSPARNLDVNANSDYVRLRNLKQVNVTSQKPLVMNTAGDVGVASQSILPQQATTSTRGIAEIATTTEVNNGNFSDRNKIVSPYYLRNSNYAKVLLTGSVYMGNIGNVLPAGGGRFTPVASGNFSSARLVESPGPDTYYTVTFTQQIFGSYVPIAVFESIENWNAENDAIVTFKNMRSNSLDFLIRELSEHRRQGVYLRIKIIG